MFFSRVVKVPSDDSAMIEWPTVPISRLPNGPEIVNVPPPAMTGAEGSGPVVCPLASINTPGSGSTSVNARKSGTNDGRAGVGEGVAATEVLVGVGEAVGGAVGDADGDGVAAPQAARAAALAISSAVRWIRIESFLSFFGVCLRNDRPFIRVTRLTRSRCAVVLSVGVATSVSPA